MARCFWFYSLFDGLLPGYSTLFAWYHSALFPAIEIKRRGENMRGSGKVFMLQNVFCLQRTQAENDVWLEIKL
jgi:hypothetical protein